MTHETVTKSSRFYCVSLTPDICKTPVGSSTPPLPYNIVGEFSQAQNVSPNVRSHSEYVILHQRSTIPTVSGDAAGKAGGIKSGTTGKQVDTKDASARHRANGAPLVQSGREVWMNSRNTVGKIYERGGELAKPQLPARNGWLQSAAQYYKDNISASAHQHASQMVEAGGDVLTGSAVLGVAGVAVAATGVGAPVAAAMEAGAAAGAIAGGAAVGGGTVLEASASAMDQLADYMLTGVTPDMANTALDIGVTAGESLLQNLLLNKIPGGRLVGKLLGGKLRSAGKKLPGDKPVSPKLEKTPPSRGGDDGKSRGRKEPKSDPPSDCCPKDSGPAGKRAHGRKPVHFGTGQEILQQTDFALERAVPLSWSRCYRSSAACEEGGLFGARWSSPYTTSLSLCLQGMVYHDHTGRALRLPLLLPGEHYDYRKEGFIVSRTTPDTFVLTWRDGASDIFTRAGTGVLPHGYDGVNPVLVPGAPVVTERFCLCRSQQRDGRGVSIARDSAGPVLLRLCFDDDTLIEALADASGTRIAHVEEVRGSTRIRHVSYGYDQASGDLLSQTNLAGHSRRYGYQHHLLTGYTTYTGLVWALEWISLAALQARWTGHAHLDAEPITVHNSHQARAICTRALDGSEQTRIDYPDQHTSRVSENGGVLDYVFDANWLITDVFRLVDGVATSLGRREWDRDGMLLAEIDGEGHRTSYTYDGAGNLLASTDALGNTSCVDYNADNLPVTLTDALGNVSQRTYDDAGRLLTVTDALGHTTSYRYDQRGNVIELTDAKGGSKRFNYNKAGQVIRYTDCSGHVTQYEYDAAQRLVAMRDALQHITRYEHDVLGRVTSITQPDRTLEQYSYDADGRLVAHIDAAGHATRYRYNGQGLPLERLDALGQILTYRYDGALQLSELINASGESCRFSYHAEGWLIAETGFDGKSTHYRHDRNGNLTGIDCTGQSTSLIRDARGLLLAKTTADGTIRYAYDALGRLTAESAPQSEQRFVYDALGQLLEERSACFLVRLPQDAVMLNTPRTAFASFTLMHAYDELGNRIRTRLPNGRRIDILRYGSGHWHGVLWQGKPVVDIERDRLHRETVRQGGNLTVTRAYDAQSRLSLLRAEQQSAILRERHFSYDLAGHLTAMAQYAPGAETRLGTLRYHYDPLGQLLGATQPGLAETFAFDPAGNLVDTPPTEHGHAAPLPAVTGNLLQRYQAWLYEHDAQGNVVRKYRRDGSDDLRLEYDTDNRIVRSVRLHGQQRHSADYFYDPFSRRIAKRVMTEQWQFKQTPATGEPCRSSVATTLFVWDGDKLLQELRQHDTVTYIHEPDSFVPLAICTSSGGWDAVAAPPLGYVKQWQLPCDASNKVLQAEIAEREAEAEQRHQTAWSQMQIAADIAAPGDKVAFYHCDHLGTPRELIDTQGHISWAARYKAWGRINSHDQKAIEQPLRFQGQYEDSETGLYYNRYRYYDPDSARYVTQDPVGLSGGLNFYQYARNPIRWIDPLGLAKYVVIGEGQAAIETYAATMRVKFPCDEFRTIKKDWLNIVETSRADVKRTGGGTFEEATLIDNVNWIKDRNNDGYSFIDIGFDGGENRSSYYKIEKETLSQIGAKILNGSPTAIINARKNSKESNRPPSKKGCK